MTSPIAGFHAPRVFVPVVLVTLAVTVTSSSGPAPDAVAALVVVAALAAGIPHGALDHRAAAATRAASSSTRAFQIRFHLAYLASMAGAALVWWVAPSLALAAFVLLSVHHFGQSDLARLGLEPSRQLALQWSRGAVVVLLPLVTHLDRVSPIVERLADSNPETWPWVADHRALWMAVLVAQHAVVLAISHRVLSRADLRLELITMGALVPLLILAHPLIGFAVYFGLWHSLAHVLALFGLLQQAGSEAPTPARFLAELVPRTALALAALAGLAVISSNVEQLVAWAFVLVSVLTVPHLAVVEQMWRRPAPEWSDPAQDAGGTAGHRDAVDELVAG